MSPILLGDATMRSRAAAGDRKRDGKDAMTLRKRAERIAGEALAALDLSTDDPRAEAVVRIVEQAIIDVVLEERERCANVVLALGTADEDKAHKIADEIHRAENALVANLSALR